MKKNEKTALVRIITDLIKANNIIDSQQLKKYNTLKELYDINQYDLRKADETTLSKAIEILSQSDIPNKEQLFQQLKELTHHTRNEALILLALEYTLVNNFKKQVKVISIKSDDLSLVNNQMIFVESGYKNNINTEISNNFRQISQELRLAGFDFVYIPKIVSRFNKSNSKLLEETITLLTPQSSTEQIEVYKRRFLQMTTAGFCRDQLQHKLRIEADDDIQPSLLFNIGLSQVEDSQYINFLSIDLQERVVKEVVSLVDNLTPLLPKNRLTPIETNDNEDRIVYNGFRRMMFDKHLLRSGVKSSIVIDTKNEEIIFSEIDVTLSGIHRREKALYTLFLLEGENGGIDFNKPDSIKQFKEYNSKIELVQKKYNAIYRIFGGEIENAPDLSISEIRLPMISRLKKNIMKLQDRLHNIDDYIIRRYKSGVYNISIARDSILSTDSRYQAPVPVADSEELGRIQKYS